MQENNEQIPELNVIDQEINQNDLSSDLVELDFDESNVAYYIVDENNNEIGVCIIENGQEVEYLYDNSQVDDSLKEIAEINRASLESAKEQAALVANSINGVKDEIIDFREEAAIAAEELRTATAQMQGMLDDVKDSFRLFKKNKKK